ncbi:MAG: hypothetical protein LW822_01925 [Phycisphaeraceae bacterium]|nr:hypothetical protein [Phycisphaeraceae bacterium]
MTGCTKAAVAQRHYSTTAEPRSGHTSATTTSDPSPSESVEVMSDQP